jgi:hypothetical protein
MTAVIFCAGITGSSCRRENRQMKVLPLYIENGRKRR